MAAKAWLPFFLFTTGKHLQRNILKHWLLKACISHSEVLYSTCCPTPAAPSLIPSPISLKPSSSIISTIIGLNW